VRRLTGRLPWAALLAALLVLGVDRFVLGTRGPWRFLEAHVPRQHFLEHGITKDRIALQEAQRDAVATRPVFVLGSSRARMGFARDAISTESPLGTPVYKLAHAGIGPFELRSAIDELLSFDPATVVWMLSEFDTHGPVRPVPGGAFASLSAVAELVDVMGIQRAAAHRQILLRLGVDGLLNSYRYRSVLGRAGGNSLRRFAVPDAPPEPPITSTPVVIPAGRPKRLSRAEHQRLARVIQKRFGRSLGVERAQARSITRGPHAEAQMALLRRGVARLRAHGVAVIVVELPLHSMATPYYDTSIRQDFLDFVGTLVAEHGVRFVALEDSGPFVDGDFLDLTHMGPAGAAKLTAATLAAIDGT
jgi:hypothetical protein